LSEVEVSGYEGSKMDPSFDPDLCEPCSPDGSFLQAQQARRALCRVLPNLSRIHGDQYRTRSDACSKTSN